MTFKPDSPTVARVTPSPNHDARKHALDMIVLHYTGMPSADAARARLCDPGIEGRVSSHYLIYEDGRVDQLVPEALRAWHAGASSWEGERDINSRSVGIEIVNPGHEFGYTDFPAVQIGATIALCRDIIARHRIRADRVVAHSDIAPARKQDPGEKFPWAHLAASGVGFWVEPAPIIEGAALAPGAQGKDVEELQRMLARYGYGTEITGVYDTATTELVVAFQRHFRPARVDGIADRSTRETLARLIAARPQPV